MRLNSANDRAPFPFLVQILRSLQIHHLRFLGFQVQDSWIELCLSLCPDLSLIALCSVDAHRNNPVLDPVLLCSCAGVLRNIPSRGHALGLSTPDFSYDTHALD